MGGEPARMEIEMIPDNDKRIDVAKLQEAVKVILEYETEMEEPQQWYDSPGKAVKEAIDYLVAAREEALPILRGGCWQPVLTSVSS